MKRIFTLSILLGLGTASLAQRLLTEDFNYPVGQLTDISGGANVSGSNWISNSGSGNFLQVTAGSLTYPNYFTNPTGVSNKLSIVAPTTSAEDAFRNFTPQVSASNSTVYASFLLTVKDVASLDAALTGTGDYFAAFLPSASTSAYYTRLYIRKGVSANTFNLGIAATSISSTPAVFSATDYAINTPHLVTFTYQFVAGAANDMAKLFVDQPFSATEPVTPQAVSVLTAGTEAADLGRFGIRQSFVTAGAASTPTADIDAIKVSTSFADASLPLHLASFKGASNGKTAQLTWSTLNEINLNGFSLEKSADGRIYSEVHFAKAINTIQQNNYGYEDVNLTNGMNYYRLKMLDKDGKYNYSSVVVINNRNVVKVEVFPNPVVSSLIVSHPKAINAVIRIVTSEGKDIKKYAVETGALQTDFTVSGLSKGTYLLIYENNGAKSVTRFVKQ